MQNINEEHKEGDPASLKITEYIAPKSENTENQSGSNKITRKEIEEDVNEVEGDSDEDFLEKTEDKVPNLRKVRRSSLLFRKVWLP